VSASRPWQQIYPKLIAKGLKKYRIAVEMDGMEDEREADSVSSEHASVRQKMGIVKTLKLRKTMRMVSRVRLVKLNKLEGILIFISVP
jgi:ABC-type multidrug transport system ATPase subunit